MKYLTFAATVAAVLMVGPAQSQTFLQGIIQPTVGGQGARHAKPSP